MNKLYKYTLKQVFIDQGWSPFKKWIKENLLSGKMKNHDQTYIIMAALMLSVASIFFFEINILMLKVGVFKEWWHEMGVNENKLNAIHEILRGYSPTEWKKRVGEIMALTLVYWALLIYIMVIFEKGMFAGNGVGLKLKKLKYITTSAGVMMALCVHGHAIDAINKMVIIPIKMEDWACCMEKYEEGFKNKKGYIIWYEPITGGDQKNKSESVSTLEKTGRRMNQASPEIKKAWIKELNGKPEIEMVEETINLELFKNSSNSSLDEEHKLKINKRKWIKVWWMVGATIIVTASSVLIVMANYLTNLLQGLRKGCKNKIQKAYKKWIHQKKENIQSFLVKEKWKEQQRNKFNEFKEVTINILGLGKDVSWSTLKMSLAVMVVGIIMTQFKFRHVQTEITWETWVEAMKFLMVKAIYLAEKMKWENEGRDMAGSMGILIVALGGCHYMMNGAVLLQYMQWKIQSRKNALIKTSMAILMCSGIMMNGWGVSLEEKSATHQNSMVKEWNKMELEMKDKVLKKLKEKQEDRNLLNFKNNEKPGVDEIKMNQNNINDETKQEILKEGIRIGAKMVVVYSICEMISLVFMMGWNKLNEEKIIQNIFQIIKKYIMFIRKSGRKGTQKWYRMKKQKLNKTLKKKLSEKNACAMERETLMEMIKPSGSGIQENAIKSKRL